jgi:hypothetical protein
MLDICSNVSVGINVNCVVREKNINASRTKRNETKRTKQKKKKKKNDTNRSGALVRSVLQAFDVAQRDEIVGRARACANLTAS